MSFVVILKVLLILISIIYIFVSYQREKYKGIISNNKEKVYEMNNVVGKFYSYNLYYELLSFFIKNLGIFILYLNLLKVTNNNFALLSAGFFYVLTIVALLYYKKVYTSDYPIRKLRFNIFFSRAITGYLLILLFINVVLVLF